MSTAPEIFDAMSYGPAPEEAGAVREWLAAHAEGFSLFIGGEWRPSRQQSPPIPCLDPASGARLATLTQSCTQDVDDAVESARTAFRAWSRSGSARARVLYALGRLIQKHSRFFAVLESLDNGKPIRETRDLDIPLAARHFTYHAGWAQLIGREQPDHEPLGVVGQIIPWNFPLLMLAWKIAPALAAGNCVVLKPAEDTSLTALFFAGLCADAGVPPGVVNILTGDGRVGELIVAHPAIAKIAFTGSTEVGRLIRRSTAGTGKSLTLELGGKSPFVVLEDADLDAAVEGLIDAIWFNQGQVCCAGSRLIVEESVLDTLVRKIKTRLSHVRIGDPLDKAIDMGALISPAHRQRVQGFVAQAQAQGATVWQPEIPLPQQGAFFPPTLLTDVSPANAVWREEIFGPVLAATSFRTLEEAIELANNTRYGLAATLYTENINRALELAVKLKAGVVWINTTNQLDAACGFGGIRESGFGREGGLEGMLDYLRERDAWQEAPEGEAGAAAPVIADPQPEAIDRTFKHYIGGRQCRPDGGRSYPVTDPRGHLLAWAASGNRKDIRDAVEAAFLAARWGAATAHLRSQILFYIAENLALRRAELAARLGHLTGGKPARARAEVDMTIERLFAYGGWADKYDGLVHTPPVRNVALAVPEPIGVVGVVCPDENPLLSFVSLLAPVIAMGNRCVIVPSERLPLPALDLCQVLETSDVPAGVVNIVTGEREALAETLARHDQVDCLWYFGSKAGSARVEEWAAASVKRTWVSHGRRRDWLSAQHGEGRTFLRQATQIKNIWLPYGDSP
ncbi:MAG TPA: aldehyde dehydrogenase family protein [Steroidobacteraceae bacterium]|nr:aldehyde dehydrogenase family protein [Steroidobacteraceae bacterium]